MYSSNWGVNIITTTLYNNISEQSILELLGTGAVMRSMGRKINKVGIFLSIQLMTIWLNINKWDHWKYVHKIQEEVNNLRDDLDVCVIYPNWINVGYHCLKQSDYPDNVPFQMFICNPRTNIIPKLSDIDNLIEKCKNKSVYIHAPYTINLCNDSSIELLKYNLRIGKKIKASGVVVHTGAHGKFTYMDGINKYIDNIIKILPYISRSCPLLIETPAGEGTDIGSSVESLGIIYDQFKNNCRIGICVDTCHVYASGIDPITYLHKWNTTYPKSIKLIHFNDSAKYRGCLVDKHTAPGYGYIGLTRMNDIYLFGSEYNIPMVRE